MCWTFSEEEGHKVAFKHWAKTAIEDQLNQGIAPPSLFEIAASMVSEEYVPKQMICGPDPKGHLDQIHKYVEAAFDHIYIHQIGPDQEGFIKFYEE